MTIRVGLRQRLIDLFEAASKSASQFSTVHGFLAATVVSLIVTAFLWLPPEVATLITAASSILALFAWQAVQPPYRTAAPATPSAPPMPQPMSTMIFSHPSPISPYTTPTAASLPPIHSPAKPVSPVSLGAAASPLERKKQPQPVTPPKFVDGEESICDEPSLDGFLKTAEDAERSFAMQKEHEQQEQAQAQAQAQRSSDGDEPKSPLPQFGYIPAPRPVILANTSGPKAIDSPEYAQAADWKLCELGIDDAMPRFVERLRKWLSKVVLAPVAAKLREAEAACSSPRTSHNFQGELLRFLAQTTRFQQYLTSPACPSVLYMLDRIKALSEGSFLQRYIWNGGSTSSDMPPDAQVLVHAFTTFLDLLMPDVMSGGKPFSSRHFVMSPDAPDFSRKGNVFLYERSLRPPHFEVVYDGQAWEVMPGRNNLFHAIVLFVYVIKHHFHSHIGAISLASPSINLITSLENPPDKL